MTLESTQRLALGGAWMSVVIAASLWEEGVRANAFEQPIQAGTLGLGLITLSAIDARDQRLPDFLTLPLLALGLVLAFFSDWQALLLSAAGAVAGYGIIAALAWYWRRTRGIEGIGLGDAKLLAAGGAWCGVLGLPPILLISSAMALFCAGIFHILSDKSRHANVAQPIAFGPFLGAAIWLVWASALDMLIG
ncbi:MAG: A24 family peptidase [Pseudomonadota bacterium]